MGVVIVIFFNVQQLPQKPGVGAVNLQAEEQVPPIEPPALIHHQPHPLNEKLKVELLELVHHLLTD